MFYRRCFEIIVLCVIFISVDMQFFPWICSYLSMDMQFFLMDMQLFVADMQYFRFVNKIKPFPSGHMVHVPWVHGRTAAKNSIYSL